MSDIITDLVLPFLLLGTFMLGVAYFIISGDCDRYAETTGRDTKMSGATCFVNKGDEWYSRDEFKHVVIDR